MLCGGVVGGLGLHQCGLRGVEIAAGNGALGEELLAAVDDALVEVEIGLGLGEVEFGLAGCLQGPAPWWRWRRQPAAAM